MSERLGLVVAQLGGPRDRGEVEPFIRALFADPDVVPIPGGPAVSRAFGWAVAKARGPFVRRNYDRIGGGSPILEITDAQARLVEDELRARGHNVRAEVAMRYTRPDTRDAVASLRRWGAERIVLLPLYPQYSFATTGSSEAELRRVLADTAWDVPVTVIRTWHDHPSYIDVQAGLVAEMLDRIGDLDEKLPVIFSAHGLPERTVERGDPYPEETARTVELVVDRLAAPIEPHLAYQSRTGPIRWIGPGTEEVLADLAAAGHRRVAMVPISFVSDHIETLYEVDMLFRDEAEKVGITGYHRSEVMNDRPEVGPMLADIVESHLR